jgi:flagellar biosynthesis protein
LQEARNKNPDVSAAMAGQDAYLSGDDAAQSTWSVLSEDARDVHSLAKADPQKAVALGYDRANDSAPRVLATGRGAVAEQIMQLAFAHGVKVRKDKALVDILEALEVDSLIPLEAFAAVAEILAYVYRANALAEQRMGTAPRAADSLP